MPNAWVVRAGEGSILASEFERAGYVGMGFDGAGDFYGIQDLDAMRERIATAYPNATPQSRATTAGQAFKFRAAIKPGDRVVTYDGNSREYLVGIITGDYQYREGVLSRYNHLRPVKWEGRVAKDALKRSSNNSFGAILTLFDPGPDAIADIEDALKTGRTTAPVGEASTKAGGANLADLIDEFRETFANTEKGRQHRALYESALLAGRENYAAIVAAADRGEDVTDVILRKLLPHTNTQRHRDEGDWIHIAPAITKDIRSWYEGAGWAKPSDWPMKAELILGFFRRLVERPDELAEVCRDFSQSRWSHALQCGMMTPMLNSLNPDRFAIVNSKVCKTFEALTGIRLRPAIEDYPASNERIREYVVENHEILESTELADLGPGFVFDVFCHWYVAEREDETEDESAEGGELERVPGAAIDRDSAVDARYVAQRICPDPAPRTTALAYFANAIRIAHAQAPTAWSVTLRRRSFRLNVGGIVAVDFHYKGFQLIVHEPSIEKSALSTVKPYDQDDNWRYIDGADTYSVPYGQLEPAISLLKTANDELIRRAISKSDKAPFRAAHSPGILAYLRESGFDVPDAVHTYGQTKSEPARIGEPPAKVGYDKAPVFSLEDVSAQTSLPVGTIEQWVRAIGRKGQAIIYGPPGTGKTFVAERLAKHLIGGSDGISDLVQFHPAYAYEDFIQGLRPRSTSGGQLTFEMIPGRFMEFCREAGKRSGTSVLIIDEINRANLAQVFGELMYLLEYRDQEIPLSSGGRLRIPPNVRIIGTMNTADRSIALVDHALRRRFAFIRLDPQLEVLERFHAADGLDASGLVETLGRLNRLIANPHYSVGISFFMRRSIRDDLEAIWKNEIEPYLDEYFFDRPDAIEEFRWERIHQRAQI